MNITEINKIANEVKESLIEYQAENKNFDYASALYALNYYRNKLAAFIPYQASVFNLSTKSGDKS